MPTFEHGNIKIEVDEDGFMDDPSLWNEEIARAIGFKAVLCGPLVRSSYQAEKNYLCTI